MAEFSKMQVFETLGIEPEAPAGGEKEQGTAALAPKDAASTQNQGEKEQESAAPAREGAPADRDQVSTPEEGRQEPEAGKPPMTVEERKEAAAQRRRQEQQAAVDEAVAEALQAERQRSREELETFFKSAQLKNTLTGKPITTMEEFREWQRSFEDAQLQRDLKAGKLTSEALSKAISETPAMQKVQEIIDRDEKAKREQDSAAAQQRIAAELSEIQKLDPSIKDLADILQMPTAKEFYGYVTQNHLSYLDAFHLANRSHLEQQAAEAARQQAMTNARGKGHMTATKAQGPGAVSVPEDDMALFRLMNPGASDKEIQDYFNKHKHR